MVIMALALSPVLLASTPVLAQTHGDQRALDSLGPVHPAHHGAVHPHHAAHRARPAAGDSAPPAAKTATVVAPPPTIPPAPPAPAVIKAQVIDVPLHPEPAPPPVPVVAGAAGSSSPIHGGTQITFGDGSADLNAGTMQALQAFAAQIKADPAARAQVNAYSSGAADDPSTPRRISLERGLAARAVLINAGIPSTRIYVRVIGRPQDGGPANRADLTRSDLTQQASAAPDSAQSSAQSSAQTSAGTSAEPPAETSTLGSAPVKAAPAP